MTLKNDAEKLVSYLVDWVKAQSSAQEGRKAPWSWVVSLITGLVALSIVGFVYYRSWRQGKELAKLQHDKDVNEQLRLRGENARALATNKVQRAVLKKKGQEAAAKVKELDLQIKDLENAKNETIKDIEELNSWSGVDKLLASRKSSDS